MRYLNLSLLFLSVFTCIAFYPGLMTVDSQGQYAMAVSHVYTDHHPPLMSWWWGVLASAFSFAPNPVPMLIFHLTLFFVAIIIIASSIYPISRRAAWSALLLILFPPVYCILGVVWKDVGMAFSFLLSASLMLRVTLHGWKYKWAEIALILLCIFYAVGIKFQGQFIAPVLIYWLVTLIKLPHKWQQIGLVIVLSIGVIGGSKALTSYMVEGENGQLNSWQLVKLYDLARMSRLEKIDLFPEYVHSSPDYNFTSILIAHDDVDSICKLLPRTQEKAQLSALKQAWWAQMIARPALFFTTRYQMWKIMLRGRYVNPFTLSYRVNNAEGPVSTIVSRILQFLLCVPLGVRGTILPLSFFTIYYALKNRSKADSLANAIIFMQAAGLALIAALFIFSLASEFRYLYTYVLLSVFTIPLAIALHDMERDRK